MSVLATSLRVRTHAITEFEFHISPVLAPSQPNTGVAMEGINSSTRNEISMSLFSLTRLSTAGVEALPTLHQSRPAQ